MTADGEGRGRISQADFEPPPISTWRATWLLIRFNPALFFTDAFAFIFVGLFPIFLGWLTGQIFDKLLNQSTLTFSFSSLIWALIVIGIVGTAVEYGAAILDFFFSFSLTVLMRKNMMSRILELPGAQSLLSAPGEMISRFAGDARNVRELAIQGLFTLQHSIVVIVGLFIMGRIEPRVTAVVFFPLIISMVLINVLRRQITRYRAAARGAEGDVTGFVGEMFGAVQAIKVAGAEDFVNQRFRQINQDRHKVALRDSLFTEFLQTVMQNSNNISIGIILLLISDSMLSGNFTIGDFALFVAILFQVARSLGYFGNLLALHKQASVSLKRMIDVLQGGNPARLFQAGPIYLRRNSGWPDVPFIRKTAEHRLEKFEVRDLTYIYEKTGRGVEDINLTINRGDFVVITGRIGAGKSTLLRAVLGLLPAEGQWHWNGDQINNPADFFIPPRTAYTPQVPRLFSETLQENILLGMPAEEVNIQQAIEAAVLEKDVLDLEDGLETIVGTRGVKLSGGQLQRAAAARMVARQPELFVFDDLSSALDVNTEKTLWERLFASQKPQPQHAAPSGTLTQAAQYQDPKWHSPTCLVVSHRRPALQRADVIIVLKNGRIDDSGTLEDLLERNDEMQRLWQGDIGEAES
ncbi:MAG: ABC transporter ATP-binding protein [Chloroflexota bacterium]